MRNYEKANPERSALVQLQKAAEKEVASSRMNFAVLYFYCTFVSQIN
jgi:hypothetical protein